LLWSGSFFLVVFFLRGRVVGVLNFVSAVHLLLESLKSTALVVAYTEDGKVVVRVVLLLKVLEFLVLELLASVGINLNRSLDLSFLMSNLTNGDCALLVLNGLLLKSLEVSSHVECPEAVNEYQKSDQRHTDGNSNDGSVVSLNLATYCLGIATSNVLLDSLVLDSDGYILGDEYRLLLGSSGSSIGSDDHWRIAGSRYHTARDDGYWVGG
jgi:hypothetical protein